MEGWGYKYTLYFYPLITTRLNWISIAFGCLSIYHLSTYLHTCQPIYISIKLSSYQAIKLSCSSLTNQPSTKHIHLTTHQSVYTDTTHLPNTTTSKSNKQQQKCPPKNPANNPHLPNAKPGHSNKRFPQRARSQRNTSRTLKPRSVSPRARGLRCRVTPNIRLRRRRRRDIRDDYYLWL